MQVDTSNPFFPVPTMRMVGWAFHQLFFPSSRETYILHIPVCVASHAVPGSGGFAAKEQDGEEGLRN